MNASPGSEPIRAYPLQWPVGWKRTTSRADGRFSRDGKPLTVAQGVHRVRNELARMGVSDNDLVISTNIETRLDGTPRSDRRNPDDPGVAVYWRTRKGEHRSMAIDRYGDIADNLGAIAATLNAMRAIERHGGAQIGDRAFTGFAALPPPIVAGMARPWRDVLGLAGTATSDQVRQHHRALTMNAHPDRGGSNEQMAELNRARDEALKEIGS